MGLAASQARFLAITARKMNCEFQSMQIAQEKLSVTRDMEKASQDYQDALDASKLVWETPDGDVYDVSYPMMMTPSNFNDYNAYLISDNRGRIVLSPPMFAAALAAGMIDENGEPIGEYSQSGRNLFLEELSARGQISRDIVDGIKGLGSAGYSKSGVGGEILDKTIANIMQTQSFIEYLKTTRDEDDNLVYRAFEGLDDKGSDLFKKLFTTKDGKDISSDIGYVDDITDTSILNNRKNSIYKNRLQATNSKAGFVISNGKKCEGALTSETLKNLTIGSLISGNYALTINLANIDGDKSEIFESIINNLIEHVAEVLGYSGGALASNEGMSLDAKSNEALGLAIGLTYDLFTKSVNHKNPYEHTADYNATVYNGDTYSVNLSNLVKSFLTNFTIILEGFEDGYGARKDAGKSTYVTDDLTHYFGIKNTGSVSEQDMLNADFYNQMYNVICMYGACTDTVKQEMVTDEAYLNNALKNGQLFISSLNTDGYFYAGHYTLNGHVGEVADEDAIARAELDYEITKSKLNSKEETLELKMKNLDMEISALSTEYETVKSMISKNVEKVFTMFSS